MAYEDCSPLGGAYTSSHIATNGINKPYYRNTVSLPGSLHLKLNLSARQFGALLRTDVPGHSVIGVLFDFLRRSTPVDSRKTSLSGTQHSRQSVEVEVRRYTGVATMIRNNFAWNGCTDTPSGPLQTISDTLEAPQYSWKRIQPSTGVDCTFGMSVYALGSCLHHSLSGCCASNLLGLPVTT